MDKNLIRRARQIKMVLLDVDGVLTNGLITYDSRGNELKSFYVRDGAAIKWLQLSGMEVALLSGRKSPPLKFRARELDIGKVIQAKTIKLPAFERLLKQAGLKAAEVAYLGDDIYDLPVLKRAGLSVCPADSVSEVKKKVNYICRCGGGQGAVREFAELILKAQGKWKVILEKYGG